MTRACFVAALLLAGAASAEWKLSERDVETLLPTADRLVLVVAAGEPAGEVRDVARAVERALQTSGRAKLVMNDAALGSSATSSDEEVHRKATSVPHDVLIIVRVYSQGSALTALLAASGAGDPRSVTLVPAQAPATTPPPVRDPNLVEYEAKRLHFGQKSLIPGKRMESFVFDEPAYEGAKPLTTDQLFERLARKEFFEAKQARAQTKLVLGLTGLGVALVGGALIVADYASPCARVYGSLTQGYCLQRSAQGLGWAGAATVGVGAVLGVVALAMPAWGSSRAEVGKAIEDYNQNLRRSLGLSAQVSANGGALVLNGRF